MGCNSCAQSRVACVFIRRIELTLLRMKWKNLREKEEELERVDRSRLSFELEPSEAAGARLE